MVTPPFITQKIKKVERWKSKVQGFSTPLFSTGDGATLPVTRLIPKVVKVENVNTKVNTKRNVCTYRKE